MYNMQGTLRKCNMGKELTKAGRTLIKNIRNEQISAFLWFSISFLVLLVNMV